MTMKRRLTRLERRTKPKVQAPVPHWCEQRAGECLADFEARAERERREAEQRTGRPVMQVLVHLYDDDGGIGYEEVTINGITTIRSKAE
jgi:hypothetical protein